MSPKTNQKGFAPLQAVLLVVIVALIGFISWFVWHSSQQSKATLEAASKSAASSPTKSTSNANTQKYFTIKEWGVRSPYSSSYTFSYALSTANVATVSSSHLAAVFGCKDEGAGQIKRLLGTDGSEEGGTGPTVAQTAAQDPSRYTKVGDYYYQFIHDQSSCSANVTLAAQNQANDFTKALVSKLEALPQ